MNSANDRAHLSPEVRAAISVFLNEAQKDTQPFTISDALTAVRRVFPDLEISDADLADAVASEASTAGLHILYDIDQSPEAGSRSLERWDDEGGAIGMTEGEKTRRREAARRKVDDTDGTRRRAKEKQERNRLI
jgi:hypothetical protein